MVDAVVADYREACRRKNPDGHPTDKLGMLSVDGMYVRQGVAVQRSTGQVMGLTELEGVDQEVEELIAGGSDKDRATAQEIFNIVFKVGSLVSGGWGGWGLSRDGAGRGGAVPPDHRVVPGAGADGAPDLLDDLGGGAGAGVQRDPGQGHLLRRGVLQPQLHAGERTEDQLLRPRHHLPLQVPEHLRPGGGDLLRLRPLPSPEDYAELPGQFRPRPGLHSADEEGREGAGVGPRPSGPGRAGGRPPSLQEGPQAHRPPPQPRLLLQDERPGQFRLHPSSFRPSRGI